MGVSADKRAGHPVPYMASTGWYRVYLGARLAGATDAEASAEATAKVISRRRDLCRTVVKGGGSQPPLLLSVPICGGAATVKRCAPGSWSVSDHGRWSDIHLGALEAAYGSAPYYPHFAPLIRPLLSAPCGRFADLSAAIHRIVLSALSLEENLGSLRELIAARPELAEALARDNSAGVTDEISIFDVIFNKGTTALYTLIQHPSAITQ